MGKVTGRLAKEMEDLRRLKDEEIDFSDIPEKTDWSQAVRGKFYRPIKESLTIRIDADILAWLRGQGKGYQTRINAMLREAVARQIRKGAVKGPRSRNR
ncbi:MAG: BrnA antitoxin family protein [Terriglobia bacterium]